MLEKWNSYKNYFVIPTILFTYLSPLSAIFYRMYKIFLKKTWELFLSTNWFFEYLLFNNVFVWKKKLLQDFFLFQRFYLLISLFDNFFYKTYKIFKKYEHFLSTNFSAEYLFLNNYFFRKIENLTRIILLFQHIYLPLSPSLFGMCIIYDLAEELF